MIQSNLTSQKSVSNKEQARILEQSMGLVFMLSVLSLKFIHSSESLRTILGHTMETLENLNLTDVGFQISPGRFRRKIVPLITGTKDNVSLDLELITSNNNYIYQLDIRITNVNEQSILVISAVDISQRIAQLEELKKKEANAQMLFDYSPILIWEEDFSKVKIEYDKIGASSYDFQEYFDKNPEEVARLASLVKVTQINKRSLDFYKVSNKDELETNIAEWFVDDSLSIFKEELISLANGELDFEGEIPVKTPTGELKHLYFKLAVPPQFKDSLEKVIVTFIDITNTRKEYFSNKS